MSAANLIAELERAAARAHDAFLKQLKLYRDISPWPMPLGYRKRIAAPYLARVYKMGNTAVEYARNFIRAHGLDKCAPVQEMITIMEAVDDAIITDEKDVINSVSFEKLTRRAYGLEKAHEDCWRAEDWKRPDGKKQWKSKVKWDPCERYDVRNQSSKATKIPDADEEARG